MQITNNNKRWYTESYSSSLSTLVYQCDTCG